MSANPSDRPDTAHQPELGGLSAWAPELAKTFVSLASDIALVIDGAGVIRNVAQGGADPVAPGASQWVGRAWIDTVSGETRTKIANLLKEVASTGLGRRREVNHPLGGDLSVPVAYTAIRLGEGGPVLAVGRDLRAIAAIQQRYVESQQDMERGYWQARQAEARYQLLFQVATDAVLVLDGQTLQIVEANEAAAKLVDIGAHELVGRLASAFFEHHARGAVNELLGNARATGQGGEIRARLQGRQANVSVAATPFRTEGCMRLLVRMRAVEVPGELALNPGVSRLVDSASDGVVVTDSAGRIQIANPAFVALGQLANEAALKGQPLMTWLGLADRPLAALVADVRRDGIARHVEAWIKRGDRNAVQVEVSAALLTEGEQECIGFTVHPTSRESTHPVFDESTDASTADALTRVLRAGIDSLGLQLSGTDLAQVVRDTAASLGISAEHLTRRLRHDTST